MGRAVPCPPKSQKPRKIDIFGSKNGKNSPKSMILALFSELAQNLGGKDAISRKPQFVKQILFVWAYLFSPDIFVLF